MANGLLDLLGGLGTTPPAYLEGLLGAQQTEDLRKQSIGTGLANALVGYLAMPKNQNLGLGRILAGTAQAGIGGAQGVYDTATQDYMQAQKIAEIQRAKEQREAREAAISQLPPEQQALYRAYGEAAVPKLVEAAMPKQRERKTATVNNVVIDTDTGLPIYTGEKELKAPPTRERQVGRTKIIEEMQADGTFKEIGRGSMDAPQKPTEITYKTETGADGNIYYVPTKPNSPILDVTGKPTNAYKPAGAKPTEGERKANTLLTRMEGSLAQLNKAVSENPDAAKPELLPSAIKAITLGKADYPVNAATSSERQRVEAAQLDILDAALTLGTGAAYTREQLESYRKSYFPQLGDSDAQVADKTSRRENLISAARIAANQNPQPAQTNQPQSQPARSKADILKQYGL
jgi:hypothetical protein